MNKIRGILVSAVSLVALLSLGLASPDGSQTYREVAGRVESFDPQGGFVVVNGQKLILAKSVRYEYGRPGVGSYVEARLVKQDGQWRVYILEVKPRAQAEQRDDD